MTKRASYLMLAAIVVAIGMSVVVNRNAAIEYAAYKELQSHGATGDDWVGLSELITGRPPIVELEIPSNVPRDVAFRCISEMRNLESLSLSYDSMSETERELVADLGLDSLRFSGAYPTNNNLTELASFTRLRFLYLPPCVTSKTSLANLQAAMPRTKITIQNPHD